MGYQLTGHEGSIASWGSGAGDWHNHFVATGTAPISCKISERTEKVNTTGSITSGAYGFRGGIRSWDVSGEALWPRANPYIGTLGSVTLSSGYAIQLTGWSLNFDWTPLEVTGLNTGDAGWRAFRPSFKAMVSGSFRGFVDSATAITNATAYDGSLATATFKMDNGTFGNGFYCAAIVAESVSQDVSLQGALQTVEYTFTASGDVYASTDSGNGSTTFGNNILPAAQGTGTNGMKLSFPTYDTSTYSWAANVTTFTQGAGTPNKTLLVNLNSAGSKSATGKAWLSRLGVTCEANQPIKVAFTAQGTGALTRA
jgi:hypothetical protein